MNRTRLPWMMAVVFGASCVLYTELQADDEPRGTAPRSQNGTQFDRLELMERRIADLEAALHATQSSARSHEWVSLVPIVTQSNAQPFGFAYQLNRKFCDPPCVILANPDRERVHRFSLFHFSIGFNR